MDSMRKIYLLAIGALMALAAPSWAGLPCLGCPGPDCRPIPCEGCPDCSCPCDHRLPLTLFGSSHAQALIEKLHSCESCDRLEAARKLGCRLHADFCKDPCVLQALIEALHCDPCFEVRRAAAWSIGLQDARTEEAVLALYVQSKVDPHYLVRVRAAEALDILIRCRLGCFKATFEQGDALVKELKAAKYAPGQACCSNIFGSACGGCAAPITVVAPPAGTPITAPMPPIGQPLPMGK
jgi:hypothetical protein